MIRNVLGSVLALAGAAAAVFSPFRAWYEGRDGQYYRLTELFTSDGVTAAHSELYGSLFTPFVVAALLTLLGVLMRSRLVVALAGVVVLGITILWMVRVGQAQGSLAVSADGDGLGWGVAGAFGGGVLLLLAAAVMSGRGRRRRRLDEGVPTAYSPPPSTVPTLDAYQAGYEDAPTQPQQRTLDD